MRNRPINFVLLIVSIICSSFFKSTAQPANNIPNGSVPPTATADPLPVNYDPNALSGNRNYIRKYDLKYPETDESLIQSNISITNAIMSSEYFDGLGRPLQSVIKRGVNNTKDLVQIKTYDDFGRQAYQYLQYGISSNNGKFKNNAFTELNTFYNTEYFPGSGTYFNEKIRYNKTEFDNSPLNRPVAEYLAGNAWGGNAMGKSIYYQSNSSGEVQIWDIVNDLPVTMAQNTYILGQLHRNEVADEDGHQTVEFLDKNGKIVLKSNFLEWVNIGNTLYPKYLHTYYVYDELERLRFVIPPLAYEQIAGQLNWVTNQAVVNELCFQYKYDEAGRVIEKKVPGNEWEYIVYDQKGRVILTQDGNLRIDEKWKFTVYDQLDRIKVTGLYTNNASRQTLQEIISIANSPLNTVTELFHWLSNYDMDNFEYPSLADAEIQTYTFYDRYPAWITNSFDASQSTNFPVGMLHSDPAPLGNQIAGNITVTKTKIIKPLGSYLADWIISVNFYDQKNRLIQTQQTNSVNGNDIISYLYDFSGNILSTYTSHTNPSPNLPLSGSSIYNTTGILKKFFYDNQGRLTNIFNKINNLSEMPISYIMYDGLGRMRYKMLGGNVESQVYTYNINGWLTGINPDWVNTPMPNWTNYFGETLKYESGFASSNLNGNITGIKWRGADVLKGQRAYGYTYDNLNRLVHAEFRENEILPPYWSNTWSKSNLDFSVSALTYDANGNILSMNQRGPGQTGPIDMDILQYDYKTISGIQTNQLEKVTDNLPVNPPYNNGLNHDFKDGVNANGDYDYDANGNIKLDMNKDISAITYSQNNNPRLITFNNGNTIEYVYDALGMKLQKIVFDNATSSTTISDYVNDHIYKTVIANGSTTTKLEYILHDEGRIRPITDAQMVETYTYDFFVKDHLGNVRATLNAVAMNGPLQALTYHATMEPAFLTQEAILFDDLDNVIATKPASGDPANTRAIVLDGDDPTRRIGTSLLLRVTPGDKFSIKTQAYYNTATVNDPIDPAELIQNLLNLLNANDVGGNIGELPALEVIQNTIGTSNFVNEWSTFKAAIKDTTKPLAFINYLFFDDNFNFIQSKSGAIQINTPNTWHELWTGVAPLEVQSPGYLYVFHSIENLNKVYFDDFDLTYYKGSLLEETHYYPYGLTMGMPMSYAAVGVDQKYKYNAKELQRDEFGVNNGLEWYDYGARMQDPQLGRWHVVDPLAEIAPNWSPYRYGFNNPIRFIDPNGMNETSPDLVEVNNTDRTFRVTPTKDNVDYVIEDGKWKLNANGDAPIAYVKGSFQSYLLANKYEQRAPLRGANSELFGVEMLIGAQIGKYIGQALGYGFKYFSNRFFSSSAAKVTTEIVEQTAAKRGAGVYDLGTTLGKYVGQSKDIMVRVTSHFAKGGKLSAGELNNAVFHSMPGSTKLQREVYEQFLINKYGINNLLNVRNPMGGRIDLYNSMVDDVIKLFGLPR